MKKPKKSGGIGSTLSGIKKRKVNIIHFSSFQSNREPFKKMERIISFRQTVQKFPGIGGWHYIAVPKKYTRGLKQQRKAWGMYPIIVSVGNTTWKTKLMMKKGGAFFVALRAAIRKKEKIAVGDRVTIFCKVV